MIILVLLSLLLFLVFLGKKIFLDKEEVEKGDYYKIESRVEDIQNTSIYDADVLGWIKVQGTNIDIPILDVNDDVATDNKLNYAWLSKFYFEGDNRKVIYGHNIRNVGSEPLIVDPTHTRFEQLPSFTDYDFAKENLYIQLTEDGKDKLYKIYAVGFYGVDEELGDSYLKENLDKYLKSAKENSLYEYDVDVNSSDEVISLVTCTRYFGLQDKTQFRVDARRVRENEKINQYSVATTDFYDIIK